MRKILIALLTVILCVILYLVMGRGINLGVFEIPSFTTVTNNNKKLDEEISNASKESTNGIEDRKKQLEDEYTNYLTAKNEYNELKKSEEEKNSLESASEIYNIEYLWTTIGNFATKNGITLEFDIVESSSLASETESNVICDLEFKCIGEYGNITNFIEDLEQNEARFSFVPEELKIVVSEEGKEEEEKEKEEVELVTMLQATFKKTGVILNKESISEFVGSQSAEEESTDEPFEEEEE